MKERPFVLTDQLAHAASLGRLTRFYVPLKDTIPEGYVLDGYGGNGDRTLARFESPPGHPKPGMFHTGCPLGQPGDFLWTRETWGLNAQQKLVYRADDPKAAFPHWRAGVTQPRHAARRTLRIRSALVTSLQSISNDAAFYSGAPNAFDLIPGLHPEQTLTSGERATSAPFRAGFAIVWDERHPNGPTWKENPLVWQVDVEPEEVPIAPAVSKAIVRVRRTVQAAERAFEPRVAPGLYTSDLRAVLAGNQRLWDAVIEWTRAREEAARKHTHRNAEDAARERLTLAERALVQLTVDDLPPVSGPPSPA